MQKGVAASDREGDGAGVLGFSGSGRITWRGNTLISVSDNREENGRFGVGNPGGGRPKIASEVRALFEAKSKDAVDGLWKLYEDSKDESLKVKILMYWTDRVAGKPAQAITDGDGAPLIPEAAKAAAMSILKKLASE